MDIPRESQAAKRRMRRILLVATSVLVVILITVGLSQLQPAAPTVDSATVWIETVKRGPMVRQVRGAGTLVPEEIRWLPARNAGRIERILALPGTEVRPDTVILELSNPELDQSLRDAESELLAAEAETTNLRVQLDGQVLTQQATAASVQSEYSQASLQFEADRELAEQGLLPQITLKKSRVRAEELKTRADIEQKRLEIQKEAVEAQLAVQRERLERLRGTHRLRQNQVEELRLRAGLDGVLQQVPVEVGQQVNPGDFLARVAEPGRLKAEVRIAETQARDIQIGQSVQVDTRNGIIAGKVSRIDPAVQNGTVTVDVALVGDLPRGARPDLSVDGTIELERLDDVLFMGRPAFGQEHSTLGLFRLAPEGGGATRTQVRIGRSSVSTVEVLEGLAEGDRVILSDMSAWDQFDRVRLD